MPSRFESWLPQHHWKWKGIIINRYLPESNLSWIDGIMQSFYLEYNQRVTVFCGINVSIWVLEKGGNSAWECLGMSF